MNRKYRSILVISMVAFSFFTNLIHAQVPENWSRKDLIEPTELDKAIRSGRDVPKIFCVGPGAIIPNSIDIGMVNDAGNLQKLKKELYRLPKDTRIVIYCGCCPYARCPDVRPAISVLREMKFSNFQLLDLPNNIKTDWISKGYPVIEKN